MKNPPGIKSVLYIETVAKLFSCLLALAAMRPVAEAATITVTDTGDTIAVDGLGHFAGGDHIGQQQRGRQCRRGGGGRIRN